VVEGLLEVAGVDDAPFGEKLAEPLVLGHEENSVGDCSVDLLRPGRSRSRGGYNDAPGSRCLRFGCRQ
jgi:hypothetical protein